jgi:FKBP-type peptidyl-prolyl cis-trans isomerase SlyD
VAKVEKGKVIEIEYTLRLEDGEIADATEGTPLPYLHGGDDVIEGLQAVLEGREQGEAFSVTLKPEEAFGPYDEELVEEVPRSDVPKDVELVVGQEITAQTEDGEEIPAFVGAIEDDSVFLDFNHPLAGETLSYEVKVASIREATAEERERGYVEVPGDHDHDCDHDH